jgi:Ankyrin repeats (many copies)
MTQPPNTNSNDTKPMPEPTDALLARYQQAQAELASLGESAAPSEASRANILAYAAQLAQERAQAASTTPQLISGADSDVANTNSTSTTAINSVAASAVETWTTGSKGSKNLPTLPSRKLAANDSQWKIRAVATIALFGLSGLLFMQVQRGSPDEQDTAFNTPRAASPQEVAAAKPAAPATPAATAPNPMAEDTAAATAAIAAPANANAAAPTPPNTAVNTAVNSATNATANAVGNATTMREADSKAKAHRGATPAASTDKARADAAPAAVARAAPTVAPSAAPDQRNAALSPNGTILPRRNQAAEAKEAPRGALRSESHSELDAPSAAMADKALAKKEIPARAVADPPPPAVAIAQAPAARAALPAPATAAAPAAKTVKPADAESVELGKKMRTAGYAAPATAPTTESDLAKAPVPTAAVPPPAAAPALPPAPAASVAQAAPAARAGGVAPTQRSVTGADADDDTGAGRRARSKQASTAAPPTSIDAPAESLTSMVAPHQDGALWKAIQAGDAKALAKRLANGGLPNAQQAGKPAIVQCVLMNRIDLVRLLIQAGADVNATDNQGLSALAHARQAGRFDIEGLLLNHGAR